jgi:hypothetical protein
MTDYAFDHSDLTGPFRSHIGLFPVGLDAVH